MLSLRRMLSHLFQIGLVLFHWAILPTVGVRSIVSKTLCCNQCDHIGMKGRPIFPKVAQKEAKKIIFVLYDVFQGSPQSWQYLCYIYKNICHQDLSKLAQSGHTGCNSRLLHRSDDFFPPQPPPPLSFIPRENSTNKLHQYF